MLATYLRRMRNDNLEIRIAGSSCRLQLSTDLQWNVDIGTQRRYRYIGTNL